MKEGIASAIVTGLASVAVAFVTAWATISAQGSRIDLLKEATETAEHAIDTLGVPIGTIVAYAGPIEPASLEQSGWLLCDGRPISRERYSRLFYNIGQSWGKGDGVHTFNLPDLRGVFLRGQNSSRKDIFSDPDVSARIASAAGGNSGDAVGSFQESELKSHNHVMARVARESGTKYGLPPGGNGRPLSMDAPFQNTEAYGGAESRPANAYVNYIVKF